ncbi:S9 family peptidase [Robertkochia marina]|uniref:S9 family peptidase n=1 Tax=Robertkochia marina TaxID=1227945 RepID=A0A4V3UXU0_9FLAO|nr:prolyl oligopeptidase family serine peptidase [Robertkochia marina]THD65670.1 S9 family peptidase [Robertkochia marina]TRZ46648.1 S9 family peptidase [Robertkochia marina]
MRTFFIGLFLLSCLGVSAQENLGYQKPSKEILELADATPAPSVLLTEDNENMLLLYRDNYSSIATLSEKELRLGGLRINPVTNIGSRTRYTNRVKMKDPKGNTIYEPEGHPENARFANFSFSPDQKFIAMTNTTSTGAELWILDLEARKMNQLTEPGLNANMGDVINWMADGSAMLIKMLPEDRQELINTSNSVPTGPTISTNDGKKAQNRTYQDLLKNPNDEFNFEQLARADIYKVSLNGEKELWKEAAMYDNISVSPNGEYVLISEIKKPFSYIVPYYRFPVTTTVYDKTGNMVNTVAEMPLREDIPKGFEATYTGKRNINWRADRAATLYFVEALDGGDPSKDVEYRDELLQLEAPFNGQAQSLLKVKNRFSGVVWGNEKTAMAYDRWFDNRNTKTYLFNPSKSGDVKIIADRNYQDNYSDPGDPVTARNEFGREVLYLEKGKYAYMMGEGFTPEGQFPFVERVNLSSLKKDRVYTSKLEDKKETLIDLKPGQDELLVRIESKSDYPNYYLRSLKRRMAPRALTNFENPYKSLANIHKEVITYKREDGLDLSGTLYLPAGYDMNSGEKLPMILWAYPREYKDKKSAGQNTQNPNEFTFPGYGSPIFWVTKGYAVLDDAAFPIIGEGDKEPNDSFRKQLVANAKAAIDALDEKGYIDRDRVAVGGHSYGAFMVANLLSHSDLFAAGIARSGAYNRTLTPFGFQREQRSYWDAPEVYYTMSPFMHADKMKTPLLLIHGEADNNSGTYPMQSERYFNALKGLGATVRLVMLPKESHGYRAKESIMHMLWEQDQWLEKYVKNHSEEEDDSASY